MLSGRKRSQKVGDCANCGKKGVIVEEHHLYRRSLRPDLKSDPQNKVEICVWCHRVVTESRAAEEALQQKLYPNPPKFRAKNDINPPLHTMNNAASSQLLRAKAASLRRKAAQKEFEAKKLREQADQYDQSARRLAA